MIAPLNVVLLEEDTEAWDRYVQGCPDATNYHQSGWRKVIGDSFGHETFYLMALRREKLCGILPLALIKSRIFGKYLGSLPFFNYGGFLGDEKAVEIALLDEARKIALVHSADYIELRHVRKSDLLDMTKQHKVTMVLELEKDPDAQWKMFDPKLRNQVRKAEKSGLSFQICGAERLKEFYAVFARNMRDLGTPVYSDALFRNVLRYFHDSARIITVISEGVIVAAGIACSFRDTIEVPWASSLKDYRAKCPNNLLYWGIIRTAIEEGYRKFDFGRSTPGGGTFKFKEQWGAKPIPLHWQYWLRDGNELPQVNTNNPKYHKAIETWKRIPVFLTKVIGPPLARNIP